MRFEYSLALALSCSVAATGIGGCKGSSDKPAVTTTTSADPTYGNEVAINSITTTRCDREVACNHVGPQKKYTTRQVCVDEVSRDNDRDLRAGQCPGGVSQTQVEKCISEIKGLRCDSPADAIERMAACQTSVLCIR